MKQILCISFLFCSIAQTLAQGDNTPKYSNEFLNIGVSARALGMSNSVVASTDDVTSGYWNPAGLLGVKSDLQFGLMHSEYFAGIAKYDYGAIAHQVDSNTAVGFSFIRFGVDNIPNTTELIDAQGNIDYNKIEDFSVADQAFIFSYARKFKQDIDLGGSFKIIHRKVGDFAKSWGFGLDFSAIYTKDQWRFGVLGRDVTSTFNAWKFNLGTSMIDAFLATGNELPTNGLEITLPRFILAGARTWNINEDFDILTELDIDLTTDGKRNVLIPAKPVSFDPHFGLEVDYKDLIYVRAGVGNAQRITEISGKEVLTIQPNIGLGLRIKGVSIDYALTDIGDVSIAQYSNVFSLRFNLNNPEAPK